MTSKVAYKKRFGFYLLYFLIFLSILCIVVAIIVPRKISCFKILSTFAGDSLDKSGLDDRNLPHEVTLSTSKVWFILGALVSIIFYTALLKFPVLTTDQRHFWLVFLGAFARTWFSNLSTTVFCNNNLPCILEFLEAAKVRLEASNLDHPVSHLLELYLTLLQSISTGVKAHLLNFIQSAIGSFTLTAIITMEEDYNECGSCFKFLKPYQPLEPILPAHNVYPESSFDLKK